MNPSTACAGLSPDSLAGTCSPTCRMLSFPLPPPSSQVCWKTGCIPAALLLSIPCRSTPAGWRSSARTSARRHSGEFYLKARYQDGSQGEPLRARPWDFSARSGGDPRAYEAGGALAKEIPPGYWIDFTRQASAFGWERLPALLTWRSSYDAARFNEFVLTDGLDWQSAMREIYPAQALITPTYLVPTTSLPSLTPRPTRTPLPPRLRVPTRTLTPTRKIGLILPLASVS